MGLSIEGVVVGEFPEARGLWKSGRVRELPLPYYWFEGVDFDNGHGS